MGTLGASYRPGGGEEPCSGSVWRSWCGDQTTLIGEGSRMLRQVALPEPLAYCSPAPSPSQIFLDPSRAGTALRAQTGAGKAWPGVLSP